MIIVGTADLFDKTHQHHTTCLLTSVKRKHDWRSGPGALHSVRRADDEKHLVRAEPVLDVFPALLLGRHRIDVAEDCEEQALPQEEQGLLEGLGQSALTS